MKLVAYMATAVAGLFAFLQCVELSALAQKTPEKSKAKPVKASESPSAPVAESAATVVVFNKRDNASADLADYYAGKRGIPKDNVVALSCATDEEITRADYDRDIAEPLRKIFEKRGWWKLRNEDSPSGKVVETSIRYMVLIRGVPLKIKATFDPYEGDKPPAVDPRISTRNEAAVDSELSVLGVYSRVISGFMNNPYYRSTLPIAEANLPPLLLVCRLDAPTPEIVRRMIDDSLAAEQRGLRGLAYIDARGIKEKGLDEGDKWLFGAANVARRKGLPVVFDIGEGLFPTPYPMTHAAIYLGWYAEHVMGPFLRPDFKFERGGIGVHIHSFSATSLRDPKRNWCAPLLASGAAATLGNVYEPFLGLTTNLDLFMDRLRSGFTFGESCYMSQQSLSWMNTFIGDPLYRPFRGNEQAPAGGPRDEWDAYRLGTEAWFDQGAEAGTTMLKASAQKFRSGMILEGLGLLQLAANDSTNAVNTFEQAATVYKEPGDILRATIHEVFQLKAMGRTSEAVALARKRLNQYPRQSGAEVLKVVEAEMTMSAGGPSPRR